MLGTFEIKAYQHTWTILDYKALPARDAGAAERAHLFVLILSSDVSIISEAIDYGAPNASSFTFMESLTLELLDCQGWWMKPLSRPFKPALRCFKGCESGSKISSLH